MLNCRVTFGVHPDTHIDEMQKSEQVMLDGSWSAKIAITGMYLLLLMSTLRLMFNVITSLINHSV
jgi:hypothetical protein